MTNKELVDLMADWTLIPNFCDRIEEIGKHKKDYEHSDFYKATKIDLYALFEKFCADRAVASLNRIADVDSYFRRIQGAINKLDLSNLNEVLKEFNKETETTVHQTLEEAQKAGLGEHAKQFFPEQKKQLK